MTKNCITFVTKDNRIMTKYFIILTKDNRIMTKNVIIIFN